MSPLEWGKGRRGDNVAKRQEEEEEEEGRGGGIVFAGLATMGARFC